MGIERTYRFICEQARVYSEFNPELAGWLWAQACGLVVAERLWQDGGRRVFGTFPCHQAHGVTPSIAVGLTIW